eukprot:scaffold308938_cov23-Prasinocladus_malaysianus.AAC.1
MRPQTVGPKDGSSTASALAGLLGPKKPAKGSAGANAVPVSATKMTVQTSRTQPVGETYETVEAALQRDLQSLQDPSAGVRKKSVLRIQASLRAIQCIFPLVSRSGLLCLGLTLLTF